MPSTPCASSRGEFHGQRHRLFVPSVVREFPFGGFGVEHHVERKFGEAGFDVSRCGGAVAREDVAPVSLTVHKQVLLSQLHQGIAYGSVAVGMELHGVSHDVCHLVVASVFHAAHGVQDAPLHGLQPVHDVRHGTFQYHVRGIVQKPVLVHAAQLVFHVGVFRVGRFVVRVFFFSGRQFLVKIVFRCFDIFAHICSGIVYSMICLIFSCTQKYEICSINENLCRTFIMERLSQGLSGGRRGTCGSFALKGCSGIGCRKSFDVF